MARPKKIKTTTLFDLGEKLTEPEKPKRTRQTKIVEVPEEILPEEPKKKVPHQEWLDRGFTFETLPSGRVNMYHAYKFTIRGCSGSVTRGNMWMYTLGCEMKDLTNYLSDVTIVE